MSHSRIIPESFPNESGLTRAQARTRRGALDTGDRRQDWKSSYDQIQSNGDLGELAAPIGFGDGR